MALNFLNPRYNRYSRRQLYSSYPEDMFDNAWAPMPRTTPSTGMAINDLPEWQIVPSAQIVPSIADMRRAFNDRPYNDKPFNEKPYNNKPYKNNNEKSYNDRLYNSFDQLFNERHFTLDGRQLIDRPQSDRPYNQLHRSLDAYSKKAFVDKNGFQVSLDVQHYQPNEITVRTENNTVVVNAKHEEKQDEYGYVSRELTRRYELPEGFKPEDVTSSLFDAVLTIKAPTRKAQSTDANIRQVQIQQQGPIRLNVSHE